tara:strand:- start:995 stop:1195 length:201 start_codon:yes stop_codon:yes gene_type:complete
MRPKKQRIVCSETDIIEQAIMEQAGPPMKYDIFNINNKIFLKTEKNELYDIDTGLYIGIYNNKKKN